jgi:hypothetical protein
MKMYHEKEKIYLYPFKKKANILVNNKTPAKRTIFIQSPELSTKDLFK